MAPPDSHHDSTVEATSRLPVGLSIERDRRDERAVSITINHVLTLGLTSIMLVGIFASTGTFFNNQVDNAGSHELRTIGNRLAAEIQVADRLAQRGGEISMTITQPPQISSGGYRVEVLTGSPCDTGTFTADTCLKLRTDNGLVGVKVPVANTTAISVAEPGDGIFVIEADPVGGGVDVGGGASLNVGIGVGIGKDLSDPLVSSDNISLSNRPPVAKFTVDPGSPTIDSVIHFSANRSADADGNITTYEWDLDGDGSIDKTGPHFDYSYSTPDKYNVTLSVTDDDGETTTVSKVVIVAGLVYNKDVVPVDYDDSGTVPGAARFNLTNEHGSEVHIEEVLVEPHDSSIQYLSSQDSGSVEGEPEIYFDPAVNSDEYVDVSSYDLRQGGHIAEMPYEPEVGASNEVLVAFSEFRGTSASDDVNITGRLVDVGIRYYVVGEDEYYTTRFTLFEVGYNQPPDPQFSYSCTAQNCSFDASATSDSDGVVTGYEWHFDDGTNDTGVTPSHTFPANGTYQVSLTATDDNGTSATRTQTVGIGTVAFDLKVNFQPASSPTPSGYVADSGELFGNRGNGYSYGWKNYLADETRDRSVDPDQRYDTLTHIDDEAYGTNDRTWELAVPSATYRVYLAMGDPQYEDQRNDVSIEGTSIGDPEWWDDHWDRYSATVTVTDNRLTITTDGGSDNAKLAFVHVEAVNPRAFDPDGDEVVMEAEHFANAVQGNDDDTGPEWGDDMEGYAWWKFTDSDASKSAALYATPNHGANAQDTENGVRLDYNVDIEAGETGEYYVWVRMNCPSSSDDSVHVGLDGTPRTYGDVGLSESCSGASGWTWVDRYDGKILKLDVNTAGTHTVNLWMREDGVAIDKIILKKGSAPPSGKGPSESDRV